MPMTWSLLAWAPRKGKGYRPRQEEASEWNRAQQPPPWAHEAESRLASELPRETVRAGLVSARDRAQKLGRDCPGLGKTLPRTGRFLEAPKVLSGCQEPWFSLEVEKGWQDTKKVIVALELLATLVGVRLWVLEGPPGWP